MMEEDDDCVVIAVKVGLVGIVIKCLAPHTQSAGFWEWYSLMIGSTGTAMLSRELHSLCKLKHQVTGRLLTGRRSLEQRVSNMDETLLNNERDEAVDEDEQAVRELQTRQMIADIEKRTKAVARLDVQVKFFHNAVGDVFANQGRCLTGPRDSEDDRLDLDEYFIAVRRQGLVMFNAIYRFEN